MGDGIAEKMSEFKFPAMYRLVCRSAGAKCVLEVIPINIV
jgi:hypothetical protein